MFSNFPSKDKADLVFCSLHGSFCWQKRELLVKRGLSAYGLPYAQRKRFRKRSENESKRRRREVLVSPEGVGMGFNVSLVEAGAFRDQKNKTHVTCLFSFQKKSLVWNVCWFWMYQIPRWIFGSVTVHFLCQAGKCSPPVPRSRDGFSVSFFPCSVLRSFKLILHLILQLIFSWDVSVLRKGRIAWSQSSWSAFTSKQF